jgi:excisionase family DNA binding protein
MSSIRWFTTHEIAKELNIHVETVRRWIRFGSLRAVAIGGKGGYRIKEKDLRSFLNSKATNKYNPTSF